MDIQIDQIISELSKIDAATTNIMSQTGSEKEKYEEFIKNKTTDFDKSLEDNIKSELASYESKLRAENESALAKIKSEAESELSRLDKSYQTHHDKWADEIFESIIKRQD